MCGIIGYLGNKAAKDIVIKGLKRLEYRGYDSAGISTLNGGAMEITKTQGKVADLITSISDNTHTGGLGIGHTRWATHGVPNNINAHPHSDNSGKFMLVHNGIIENYETIKIEIDLSRRIVNGFLKFRQIRNVRNRSFHLRY